MYLDGDNADVRSDYKDEEDTTQRKDGKNVDNDNRNCWVHPTSESMHAVIEMIRHN